MNSTKKKAKKMTPEWLEAFRDSHRGSYRPAGICLACRRGSGCNGRRYRNSCGSFIPREPKKQEWKQKYADLLREMMKPHVGIDEMRAFGNAGTCRRAMLEIHGFGEKDLQDIENSVEELKTETGRHRLQKLRWKI